MPRQEHGTRHRGGDRHSHDSHRLGFEITFRTGNGTIEPGLFDSTAKRAAKSVADCRREHNKSTQLRRFYDELVLWEEKVSQNTAKFDEHLPFIRMLKAKAAYAQGRKLVDPAFVELVEQTIDSVKNADDLRVAKLFLEAFMGFYKLEKGD